MKKQKEDGSEPTSQGTVETMEPVGPDENQETISAGAQDEGVDQPVDGRYRKIVEGIRAEISAMFPPIDMQLKIQLLDKKAKAPTREHESDAGLDLYALEHTILPRPGDVVAVRTGIAIELPPGYHAEIRSRSGMALKHSVVVANSPGTIDNGYRGEIKVLLTCLRKPYKVEAGDRIAQIVLSRDEIFPVAVVDSLSVTERGAAGMGSSGK